LSAVGEIIKGGKFKLGAQNIFYHDRGSYTGEISPAIVSEVGAEYTIVGHSEQRKLGETDEDVNRKIQAALTNDLIPIVCVGETFEQYQQKKTDVVIIQQVMAALTDIKLEKNQKIVLAYEPVWVIGSGQAVEYNIVEHIVQIIIHTTLDLEANLVDKIQVVYGGSVDANNVNDFLIGNLSTGIIVGNESLKAKNFLDILNKIN
jgi:triosephosphate isomerase